MADPVVALGDMKQHLKVDFSEDDTLIQQMINTAEEACRSYLSLGTEVPEPAALVSAVKMHVVALYEARNGVPIPSDALDILREYREWSFG